VVYEGGEISGQDCREKLFEELMDCEFEKCDSVGKEIELVRFEGEAISCGHAEAIP